MPPETHAGAQAPGLPSVSHMDIVGSSPGAAFVRSVTIPGLDEPFVFGVHPDFADHYGLDMDRYDPRPTTNDMFVAAVGSCLAGVYALALEARGVTVTGEQLDADIVGDLGVPEEGGASIVRSIHVVLRLRLPEEHESLAHRVHGFYHEGCLLTQTLAGSRCAVSSELRFTAS
jgi:organic hydroperoxide reductase OsmC/OhrA